MIFAAGILFAGLIFSRAGRDMKSFFAAGGAVPWGVSGLSLFMGFFSAGTFVVWGSIAYTHGWVAISIQLTMALAGFVVGGIIAPRWHKTKVLTAAEFISNRLGGNVQKLYTYLFLFISLFLMGSFLYPVARIVEISTDISLVHSILLLGGVSILYVSLGGLWAVVVTDVLQFIILTAVVLIVIPLSFGKVGGVENFVASAPSDFFNLFNGEYTIYFILAFALYNSIFLGGNWSYVQRYTSVKTPKDARKVGLLFGSLYLICPILWMLPPMIYRVYNPELSGFLADEGAYLLMCKATLPMGLMGLMIGGMIFATASSLNGTLNISAGVVTNDIYKRLKPNATDAELMKVARFSTIALGVLAICIALMVPKMGGIVNVVISVGALTGVPLYLPIIWTIFSKFQTATSVITATLTGLIINCAFKFVTPALCDFSLSRAEEMMVGVSIPVVVLIIFELIYRAKGAQDPTYDTYVSWKEERDAAEQAKIDAMAGQPEPENEGNNLSTKVISIGVLLTGLLITILGFVNLNAGGVPAVIVGAVLACGGATMYYKQKKR
ncbi:MAG: sodium:solute symporter family protein [Rikenellaceae bacterium]